ncbi:pilus (MSHA type) biogenesis protein MshL [Motiliproteus sediminis]|uniref:pilus (MSHA type) biogenesis protein MshL n=1 Tax=Motiliproteus sediminis TaxID=1468178 RepID=UPI001AEF56B4|nr:pilus (MSHA type) biogenesis protein MshL [Motiliproteus sediminis]
MELKLRIAGLALLVLAGCQPYQPISLGTTPQEDGLQAMGEALENNDQPTVAGAESNPAIMAALLPPLQVQGLPGTDPRFDLAVEQMDARSFFMGLVRDTPYNMVVSEQVGGSISLDLKDVTVDEVMQTVHEVYGYEYKRFGNLYQVVPAKMETAIFQINYLNVKRDGGSDIQVSAGTVTQADQDSNSVVGTRINTTSSTDFWGQLQATLQTIIGADNGRTVVITPQAGVIVVRALPSEIATVRDYLQQAELTLQRQVILEAKILEVRLSEGYQSGINWQGVINNSAGDKSITLGQSSEALANPLNTGGVFSAAFDLKDFTALIELLETQGDVQVLSSPRVATLNNQKAVIKVGTDEFFVTDIETTTTTGTATTTTPDIELTPFFSGIALDVTPQISARGEIILHIHPSISEVTDQQKMITIGTDTLQLPLALSTIRESDSVVRASSGQVIVIGGLMQSTSANSAAKVPSLGDVGVVGGLFRQERRQSVKSELVIMLRPTIADAASWQRTLEQSLGNFEQLYEGSDGQAR